MPLAHQHVELRLGPSLGRQRRWPRCPGPPFPTGKGWCCSKGATVAGTICNAGGADIPRSGPYLPLAHAPTICCNLHRAPTVLVNGSSHPQSGWVHVWPSSLTITSILPWWTCSFAAARLIDSSVSMSIPTGASVFAEVGTLSPREKWLTAPSLAIGFP